MLNPPQSSPVSVPTLKVTHSDHGQRNQTPGQPRLACLQKQLENAFADHVHQMEREREELRTERELPLRYDPN